MWYPEMWCPGFKVLYQIRHLVPLQQVAALRALTHPRRPFLAVIAGSKLDTKIGTIRAVAERADHVMLGGQLYNAYVAAKFGVVIAGVFPEVGLALLTTLCC
jgi:phosphoglycerate kinase